MPPHGLSVRYEMKRGMEDHKRESQGLERLDCFCFYFFWGGEENVAAEGVHLGSGLSFAAQSLH